MAVIDADTHVDETDETWEHMQESELEFKPTTAFPQNPDPKLPPTRYWMIDGKRQLRFIRDDEQTGTTVETRELLDVQARLRDMDRFGTDVQVVYPTLFLMEATDKPEISGAMRRSYNRWLAERCAQSRGRLRWICLPPLQNNMEEALKELRFARDHGACGVLKKGDREGGKWPADPYFFPFYEEAQRLDLPVCFHTGSGVPDFSPAREFSHSQFMRTKEAAINGVHAMLFHNIPTRFPRLRFGYIEAGASWAPFLAYELRRQRARRAPEGTHVFGLPRAELAADLFKSNRIYITCQVDEDLPYILKHVGEDNLMIGSDYTHRDASKEHEFRKLLGRRAERGEIPQSAVGKILYDNPKAFYGL